MERRLNLQGPEDAVVYRHLVYGFLVGGQDSAKGKEAIYQMSRIKKELFACGRFVDVPLQALPSDEEAIKLFRTPGLLVYKTGQGIVLRDGKCGIQLYQHDWDFLGKRIEAVAWGAIESDEVAELLDRISAAPVVPDSR